MNSALQHPAVDIATRVMRESGFVLEPVAVLVRDEVAAVLLENETQRFVVWISHVGEQWLAPGITSGTPRRMKMRPEATQEHMALGGVSRRGCVTVDGTSAWAALVARAACDVAEVTVTSLEDEMRVPVSEHGEGLVFAMVKMPLQPDSNGHQFERPAVHVRLRTGEVLPLCP